jgi:uncharacterized metal-binding protein YceD (DUF177 family)
MVTPEFSRRIAIDKLGNSARAEQIAATPAECIKLAVRFGWHAVTILSAEITLTPRAASIAAKGHLHAVLDQRCVVTGEPVPARIDQDFDIRFVAAEQLANAAEEVELSADDLDIMEHDGVVIDLGEAVAQTLALSVEPFPRGPGADAAIKKVAGEKSGPFAGLKGLLDGGA